LRSKARWYENGKRNSKYFLNLEKRNFLRKKISKLKLSSGEETDDAKIILEEEKTFYESLYCTRNVNPNYSEFDAFLILSARVVNIVKFVGLTKLIYNASVLPVPKNFRDQVNKITFNFI